MEWTTGWVDIAAFAQVRQKLYFVSGKLKEMKKKLNFCGNKIEWKIFGCCQTQFMHYHGVSTNVGKKINHHSEP